MFLKHRNARIGESTDDNLTEEERLLAEKLAEEEKRQDFLDKIAKRLKEAERTEKREVIEYYKFPTIMGWYFDGNFPKDFSLYQEYAEYFNEIENQFEIVKDMSIEETLTEKAFRNFWPPKYRGNYFRTRGVYLDLPEVTEDPPQTAPPINYEKQHGIIGIEMVKESKETRAQNQKRIAKLKSKTPNEDTTRIPNTNTSHLPEQEMESESDQKKIGKLKSKKGDQEMSESEKEAARKKKRTPRFKSKKPKGDTRIPNQPYP